MSYHWAAKYIGIPYRLGGRDSGGLDCYGLVKLVYLEQRRISLPDLPGIAEKPIMEVCREILAQTQESWTEVAKPVDGCLVAMSQSDALHHAGVWADADGGKVVHAYEHVGYVIAETILFLRLKGFRTIKFLTYGLHH